jgi:macrolide transport system ATP-binding/permease protein
MGWLQPLFSRGRRYNELSESIREHLDEKIADLVDRGMTPDAAERSARREFGNVTLIEERSREVWQWAAVESVSTDIRFAFRQLGRSPGFAMTAGFTLSLGIAAIVSIFSLVDAALIEPLPYRDPSQLVQVFESIRQAHRMTFSHDNYLDVKRANRVFVSMAAYDVRRYFVLQEVSGAEQVNGTSVTGGFFRTLGIAPMLGRDFRPDPGNESLSAASAEVILSYAAWLKRFAGDSDVLGKTVTLNGESYAVVGVLPRSFQFAPTGAAEFWTTLHPFATDSCESERGCHVMGVIARLKDGVTVQQALDNVRAIAALLKKQYPSADRDEDANMAPLTQVIVGDVRPILLTLLGGAGLLLLIAYVNVASLLLVRSENRRREFAVRGALGAVRGRLVRQFITEGLVVVVVSGALGVVAALLTRHFLLKLVPADMLTSMPYLRASGWNFHIAEFSAALVLIAAALFAVTPMLRLPVAGLRAALTEGDRGAAGRTWRLLGSRLVVLELATSVVLLVSAGLLAESFYRLVHVDIGFVPDHLATVGIVGPQDRKATDAQVLALHRAVVSCLSHLPGVAAVGTANGLPVGWVSTTSINFVGETDLKVGYEVGDRQVSGGYFSALKAHLERGRYLSETDNAATPRVVMINETLAKEIYPNGDPIGKQIFFSGEPQHPMQIIGVVADLKEGALDEKNIPFIYRPFEQVPFNSFGIVIRTSPQPASLLPAIIDTIHSVNPEIAISAPTTMLQTIGDSPAAYLHRVSARLVGGFAVLALVLTVIGLYGVIAYSVSTRTREIGVRMALGAQRSSVYRLVLREAGWLTLVGLAIGLAGSIAAGMSMRSLLFKVGTWDVPILGAVSLLLLVSTLLASFVPAHRAAAVDPMQALRAE